MDRISVEPLLQNLERALLSSSGLNEAVAEFQDAVWSDRVDGITGDDVEELLGDLAYDIDFYESDEITRAEDYSFFGDDIFRERITSAAAKIRECLKRSSSQ